MLEIQTFPCTSQSRVNFAMLALSLRDWGVPGGNTTCGKWQLARHCNHSSGHPTVNDVPVVVEMTFSYVVPAVIVGETNDFYCLNYAFTFFAAIAA